MTPLWTLLFPFDLATWLLMVAMCAALAAMLEAGDGLAERGGNRSKEFQVFAATVLLLPNLAKINFSMHEY